MIYHRSRLQQRTSGQGRMLAVGLDAESLMRTLDEKALDEFGRRVSVAAINSPSAVTIAGDSDVLDDVARQLDEAEIFNRYLAVKVPYHTHYMDAVKDDLFEAFDGLSVGCCARYRCTRTVTGERLDGYEAGAAYWWQNTRATVLFEPAMRRMLDDGYTHFVELAPHPVLAASILETAGAQRVSVLATQRREHDDHRTLLSCVGALHSNGHDVDWACRATPRDGARLLKLPSYPWQTKRYWNETPEATEALFYDPVHPLLGQPVSGVHPTWEAELSTCCPTHSSPTTGCRAASSCPERCTSKWPWRQRKPRTGRATASTISCCTAPSSSTTPATRCSGRRCNQDDGHARVRRVHRDRRRRSEVDDHRDRGAQHLRAPPLPATTTATRRADHLDRRR